MKIEEAKNIVAVKHGYENFEQVMTDVDCKSHLTANTLEDIINEAMLLHTKHHVEKALKAADNSAKMYESTHYIGNSILNAYSIENIQ